MPTSARSYQLPCYAQGKVKPALRRVTRGAGRAESPSHGFAVPAPFRQGGLGTGDADCHSQCAHWLRNDTLLEIRYKPGGRTEASAPTECNKRCGGAGRCGERIERRRWRMKRDERVAAVKILSGSRKAASKFWAPQQGHRPLRRVQEVRGERNPPVTALP